MAEDPVEALERQVRHLTREVADLTRQVEHEQKMRGFLEDRMQRLETSVHHKMRRGGPAAQSGGRRPDACPLRTDAAGG
jgi:predicted RNase H-like nuclease (RuvC/YqgF family)